MDLMYILTFTLMIVGCFFFIVNNIASAIGSLSSASGLVRTVRLGPWIRSIIPLSIQLYSFIRRHPEVVVGLGDER
jgi:hypothetical protein